MDSPEKSQLENELAEIQSYLDHPISKQILADNADQQARALKILLDYPIRDVADVIAHFEARGHLRGLKKAEAGIRSSLEDIKKKLKEL